ncbi:MAG: hypothetical protein GY821_11490 [Gammaproteobacteria bacterium]|nr:hypothetical protein [Gammaproteobacteria bacterium]
MSLDTWDELSHWGPHAKLIYYNNGLINISQDVIHKNYPPASALFYYYFFRLTGYSEGVAYIAQTILMLAPLAILLQNFSWKRVINAIIFYSLTIELMVAFLKVSLGYRITIYMDSAVGIFVGMSLVYYFQSDRGARNILYLAPVLFSFMLLKVQLMPLALLVLVMLTLDQLLILRREKLIQRAQEKSVRQKVFGRIGALIFLFMSPFLAMLSWNHYLASMHLGAGKRVVLSLPSLINIVTFTISDKERLILQSFVENLHYPLIKLSILFCLVALLFFLKKTRGEKKQLLFIHSYMLLGFIAYLCGLLLMYSFGFEYHEAIHLASFHRYLGIYYTAWFLLVLSNFSFIFRSSAYTRSKKIIIPLLLIAILFIFNILHFNPLTYLALSSLKCDNPTQFSSACFSKIFSR